MEFRGAAPRIAIIIDTVDKKQARKPAGRRPRRITRGEITTTSLTEDVYSRANYRVLLGNYRRAGSSQDADILFREAKQDKPAAVQ